LGLRGRYFLALPKTESMVVSTFKTHRTVMSPLPEHWV
jgi:hypothetical protein